MSRVILESVRVDFPIYGTKQRSLRAAIFRRATGGMIRHEGRNKDRVIVRALSDVSLELEEGDRLGLVGHNGSGKSTLLKIIAGIYEPTAGYLTVEGRVTPLFDMMPGLDPEDNGYENIVTSGLMLGMSRDQIESRIPEIEEFCELGEYLSLPVRTYSAGMTMRLGFALVTALEPDVLLMDEGFGTGDLRFTERATDRMNEFIGRSRIMVVASHSNVMIKKMCNKAALMKEGRILAVGPVEEILEQYNFHVHGAPIPVAAPSAVKAPANEKSTGDSLPTKPGDWDLRKAKSEEIELLSVNLCGARSGRGGRVATDEEIELKFHYRQFHNLSGERFVFQLATESGEVAFTTTDQSLRGAELRPAGEYTTACIIPSNLLNKGAYVVRFWAGIPWDRYLIPKATIGRFDVVGPGKKGTNHEIDTLPGVVRPKLEWRITAADAMNASTEVFSG
jgi:ABC-type polysaccharide/polyol phosphate transport system ATPase subunit